jgi:Baseplate J-like protein
VTKSARPLVEQRDAAAFVAALLARRPGFLPKWQPGSTGADVALAQAVGRYLEAIGIRLNQAPDKYQLALLELLGVGLMPAQAARAPVIFTLSDDAGDSRVPAGTRLAAQAPQMTPIVADPAAVGDAPATTPPSPVLFETERSTGLASGKLVELRSLWPGRDQSIDHMPALGAGQPFQLWKLSELEDMPHHLYIAHRTLLALSGESHVAVELELSQGASEPLDSIWEYWDGKVWRPFKNTIADCDKATADREDSTARFQQTGTVHLLTECAEAKQREVAGTENFWVRGRLIEPLLPDPAQLLPEVEQIQLSTVIKRSVGLADDPTVTEPKFVGGFAPDLAIADGAEVDLSKPFYPFGLQPQPGSVFYFSSEETFSKPGADLQFFYARTATPQDDLGAENEVPLPHSVAWEYWNGREWAPIPGFADDPADAPADLDPTSDSTGTLSLTVPDDMEPTTVADVEARWMRVRLVSGGYGFSTEVVWTDTTSKKKNTFTYVVSRPPAISELKLGYAWTFGPFAPERVLTYNDFQYTDRTDEAIWPGRKFQPFNPPADVTPALYLGFDKPLPVDALGIFFDIEENRAETIGPALVWEHWDGGAWQVLRVDDETRQLRLPGLVSLIGPGESQPLARFGTARSWLRVRLKEDGPPGEPTIRGVFPNATYAVQQQTVIDDPIGASTGLPNQVFAFRQSPVLDGERIEVREFAGPRAGVEWRIVALELFSGDQRAVREIETLVGREGMAPEVEYGPLRLLRDRNKQVTEVWVAWRSADHLLRSGPNDRDYVLERSRGRLQFGDGTTGKVPPAGAAIMARRYQTGGGSIGNLPAGAISQLQASIGGVDAVANPVPAEGGADAETFDAVRARGPFTLRHRGRGLSVTDLATVAREASPAVAVANVIPARSVDGRRQPGHVTLVIIPASPDPRPWPSFGLRERVRRYVEARAEATLAGLGRIDVTGPEYVPVDVDATIVPFDPTEAGAVEQRARAAVGQLLHPLIGGPAGMGWQPGRDVYLSDLAAVLERVAGVDYVDHLAISVAGRIAGEKVDVAPGRTVVAGELRLKLTST